MKQVYTRFYPLILILFFCSGCGTQQETAYKKALPSSSPVPSPSAPIETTLPENTGEASVTFGHVEEGTYTNTYAGFGCDLDEDWVFYTTKELIGLPYGILSTLAVTPDSGVNLIADMKADSVDGLSSINVMYTKLDTQSQQLYTKVSEEDILDITLKQSDTIISNYSQAEIEVESIEKVETDFLGEKHFALHIISTWNGTPYFTLQFFDYKAGLYGVTVTFSSFSDDTTETLAGLFYKVD